MIVEYGTVSLIVVICMDFTVICINFVLLSLNNFFVGSLLLNLSIKDGFCHFEADKNGWDLGIY